MALLDFKCVLAKSVTIQLQPYCQSAGPKSRRTASRVTLLPGPDYTQNKVSTALPSHLTRLITWRLFLTSQVRNLSRCFDACKPPRHSWADNKRVIRCDPNRLTAVTVASRTALAGTTQRAGVSQKRAGRPFRQCCSCVDLVWICRVHMQAQSSKAGATEQTALLNPSHFAPHLSAVGCQRKTSHYLIRIEY